jgi:transcription antitermination factor NusG
MLHSFETAYPSEQSNPALDAPAWFALQTLSRHEKKVAAELESKGITAFLPLFSANRQWSDRQRKIDFPVFPGYVFVQIQQSANVRAAVLRTRGVTRFLGTRGAGIPILESEIDNVRALIERGVPFVQYPYLQVGQLVRIRGGALEGIEGLLVAVNGDQSLVISVEIIQRSLAVRITGHRVEPA